MKRKAALAAALVLLVGACRARPPETRIVVVTATPVPIAPVVLLEPTVTPVIKSAEFSFPVVEPTGAPPEPPAAPAAVGESVSEPRREAGTETLHERMVRCLVFEAEKDQRAVTSDMYRSVYARVKARNNCDTSLPGEQSWIEVRAVIPVGGRGLIAQEYARFPGPIPARGTAETVVRIMGEGIEPTQFFRFEVSLWSEAGTGRRPDLGY